MSQIQNEKVLAVEALTQAQEIEDVATVELGAVTALTGSCLSGECLDGGEKFPYCYCGKT